MRKLQAATLWRSFKSTPIYWVIAFLFTAFVGDLVLEGIATVGSPWLSVLKTWWARIEWLFEHPLGEMLLLVSAGYLVWKAVEKTISADMDRQRLIEEQVRETLAKNNDRLDALFVFLTADTESRLIKQTLEHISHHEARVNAVISSSKWGDFEEEHPSLSKQLKATYELKYIIEAFESAGGNVVELNSEVISLEDRKAAKTIHLDMIDSPLLDEVYRNHMAAISHYRTALNKMLVTLDKQTKKAKDALFEKIY